MKLLDAVAVVLAEANEPLNQKGITSRILERGLWSTKGKTPDATVGARLYVDLKKHGDKSRFQLVGKNLFALRAWDQANNTPAKPTKSVPPEDSPFGNRKLEKTLSFNDAAERILLQSGNKEPLHYREITARALKLGLLHSEGLTPEATLYAQVLTEIARKTRRGETPRFVKHGKGFIGLTRWMGEGLVFQIEQHNANIRKKLRKQMFAMPPAEFEELVGELLGSIGFEQVNVTGRSGDGGIDVRGTLVVSEVIRTRVAVQVKRWKKNVQSFVVQQVRGSLGTHEQGLIITTSDFSAGARDEAARSNAVPVALMNGEQLVALLVEHNIGVHRSPYDLLEIGESETEPSAAK